jgi:hypothetical protein
MQRNPIIRACAISLLGALLLCAAIGAHAESTEPATADLFEREALKLLKASHANKRGVVLHVNGEEIAGLVKAIGPDVVVMSSREFETVIVRREKIDAIEAY